MWWSVCRQDLEKLMHWVHANIVAMVLGCHLGDLRDRGAGNSG
jgi:hypothetical protein